MGTTRTEDCTPQSGPMNPRPSDECNGFSMDTPRDHSKLQSLVEFAHGSLHHLGLKSERRLIDYFYMPLKQVGVKLGVCTTTLKRICRDNGVGRWPYRKLRSLEKRIAAVQTRALKSGAGNDDEIVQLQRQILTLERKQLLTVKGSVEEEFWK